MRVVFRVEEEIPGLAEEGDFLVVSLDGQPRPLAVVRRHPSTVVTNLADYAPRLSLVRPQDEVIPHLAELLRRLYPPPPPLHVV